MVKKLLLSGLAAIIMGFSPSCDNGSDEGCTTNEHCKGARVCNVETGKCVSPEELDIYTETSEPKLECKIKTGFGGCEDISGVYDIESTTCPLFDVIKYDFIGFKMNPDFMECTVSAIGIKPNNTGNDCLYEWGDSNTEGNHVVSDGFEFVKCPNSDLIQMYWNFRECEALLNKYSSEIIDKDCYAK